MYIILLLLSYFIIIYSYIIWSHNELKNTNNKILKKKKNNINDGYNEINPHISDIEKKEYNRLKEQLDKQIKLSLLKSNLSINDKLKLIKDNSIKKPDLFKDLKKEIEEYF